MRLCVFSAVSFVTFHAVVSASLQTLYDSVIVPSGPSAQLSLGHDDPSTLVQNYASVGDSYSAGIGAGNKNGEQGDYLCSRYDASFPSQISHDLRLGDFKSRNFTYLPCSGATTDEILVDQVGKIQNASQDVITVTAGGNDAYLTEILNECIFQWYSNRTFEHSECPSRMSSSQSVIDSPEFHKRLDDLLSALKLKLRPGGHIYYPGYAEFFGEEDDQCDGITWAFFWKYGRREFLEREKRSQLNTLVRNMNKVLSDAVERAGDQVTFINYNDQFIDSIGRFCEVDHAETNGNRNGLLFYEWSTDDSRNPTEANIATTQAKPEILYATSDLVMHGTFMGRINELFKQAAADPLLEPDVHIVPVHGQSPISIEDVNASESQRTRGFTTNIVPDAIARVFHPRPDGHALIADLVVQHILTDRAASPKEVWLDDEL